MIKLNGSLTRNNGFTLIEVLISSFILFLVITAITMIYRGAVLSSGKAERTLLFVSYVEPINENIRSEIKASVNQTQLSGEGSMGKVIYKWAATVHSQARALPRMNVETQQMVRGNKNFKLWDISLELQVGNAIRVYETSEISW